MIRVLRPIPVETLKLLVFDLDGTLIDSAQDLCNSVNATLAHFGRTPLPDEVIATYIGNGALMLVRRAFGLDDGAEPGDEFLAQAHRFFLDYYREHKLDYTYAYEGVLEALDALRLVHDQLESPAQSHGRADQQARSPRAGYLRSAGPGSLFSEYLRRQQLQHQETGSRRFARADERGRCDALPRLS